MHFYYCVGINSQSFAGAGGNGQKFSGSGMKKTVPRRALVQSEEAKVAQGEEAEARLQGWRSS